MPRKTKIRIFKNKNTGSNIIIINKSTVIGYNSSKGWYFMKTNLSEYQLQELGWIKTLEN